MTQGLFPFQYEVKNKASGMTALAGLPPYLEFGYVMDYAWQDVSSPLMPKRRNMG